MFSSTNLVCFPASSGGFVTAVTGAWGLEEEGGAGRRRRGGSRHKKVSICVLPQDS